jgi:DNA polymerase-1
MELVGMPINLGAVLNAETTMDDISRLHYKAIMSDPLIVKFNLVLRELEVKKANARLKKLRKTTDDFLHIEFNPNSHTQLALFLHDHLQLPILNTTDTGKPATDNKTLKSLIELLRQQPVRNKDIILLIEHLIELADVAKILNTFIPAFLNNSISKNGWEYLHGNFNLGGTKSGRLSSNKPNLTNIPSTGTQYAKPIKQCFQAPPFPYENKNGWLMVGADSFSLEDKVSALLTKDPNKLKIYTDGYDGHCLRAYKYFGDKMPDIIPDNVASINSIETKYPKLRQASKSPTFLLTYMGTWHGLMKQFGFTKEEAQKIENDYHELYKVSDDWVMAQVREASKTGYLELAFGLRLRTPILPQIIFDSESMPYQAQQEIRTAGNALGQSYCLLNTRAANEFMERVWKSKYALKVLPISQIHDSQYYMIENSLNCLKWVNDNLIECMEWNKLAPIQHPTIKLGAALEIYYPDWSCPIKIPNRVSIKEVKELLNENQRAKRMLTTTV